MKEKVSPSPAKTETSHNKKNKKKQKEKWTSPKDFKFLKPIKWLPGFRTAKHWKRIVALIYYCVSPTLMFLKFGEFQYFGVFIFIMALTLPFMLCSFATFMETKEKYYAIEALIAAAVFGCDNIALMFVLRSLMQALN